MQNSALNSKVDHQDRHIWENFYPAGRNWHMDILQAPIDSILDQAAANYPDRPAIDFEGQRLTYTQLNALVAKIATGLQARGVQKGVKVGLFLPNSHYSIAFYFGILKAGGTVVNYNPLYAERELINQIEDSETMMLVVPDMDGLIEKAQKVRSASRLAKLIVCPFGGSKAIADDDNHITYQSLIDNDGKFAPAVIDPANDIAVLQYTGGTTGIPKGAMLTHANLYANVQQLAHWYGDLVTPGQEIQVGVLPFFHVFALTAVMNLSVLYGMEVLPVAKFDLKKMLALLAEKKPTFLPAVPAIFGALAINAPADLDISYVKFCLSGGAPLPGEIRRGFEDKTGVMLGEGYGLTETSPVVTCNPPVQGRIKTGSIGQPIPGTIVEIISMEDGKTILAPGEKGEICVRGPQVMKGYYKQPEATAEVMKEGRFHTGDIGYMDEEGYIFIVDRLKDMVLVNGFNVYPRQVEEAIYLHPAVEECIVAGVPDEKRGEAVQAWIKPRDGMVLEERELRAFLQDKIAPVEIPRKMIIRDVPLPKTAVGKLSKLLLLEQEGIRRASR